jgi:hypothetical protein
VAGRGGARPAQDVREGGGGGGVGWDRIALSCAAS